MPPFPGLSSSTKQDSRPGIFPTGSKSTSTSSVKTSASLRTIARMGSSLSSLTLTNKLPSPSSISEKAEAVAVDSPANDDDLTINIMEVRRAMDLFLDSRIPEAEAILQPKRETSLYHSLGHAFILFLRSIMTFQQTDVQSALAAMKDTIQIANGLRKNNGGWLAWMKGITINDIKAMSRLHRHAELVYAEAYLLKALLSILHDESFVSFLREGLHVRNSYNTYRLLEKYVSLVKEEADAGKDISAYELDDHFASGVGLGIGCFNIILSLLPNTVLKLAEFIGFSSDRAHGMHMLETVGGWDEYKDLPADVLPPLQGPDEGLRRQFCDMVLMLYHIVLSKLIPLSDVEDALAERVLAYNLKLYPSGVFFLYFSGRQLGSQGRLEEAMTQYRRAIDTQKDWKQLQHMCFWELGLICMVQQQWQESFDLYSKLHEESNWSKAVYTYLKALSLYSLGQPEKLQEVQSMMTSVTGAKQKIAGKSIPLEKFVARKARKFLAQHNSLLLPDLEILNAFGALSFMPKELLHHNLARINSNLEQLEEGRLNNLNYYDDICLAHYLRAMMIRMLVEEEPEKMQQMHRESLDIVFENANKVLLDHYIYYFARYENARMMIVNEQFEEAEKEIQIIVRASEKGQYNVGAGPHAKNKYSLENALLFKCHNCITEIRELAAQKEKSSETDSFQSCD
ncbi:hypothetical protein DFQ28_008089 [Apophysomyces sp. BC1034]|nr:hypothetical protein DFQ30_007767 [Apophysomyces sp. BC1015]KAG0176611.1 hypothetical protein DFQ29_005895 [Apophysomyces sp. BC1021]KAG0186264.1 hypothetical protein DFQ28_008089 [Apophysomyces sp. BC1034]